MWLFGKKKPKVNHKLSKSKKIPFNIEKLINALGGIKNIKNACATHKKISINFMKKEDIDTVNLKKIKCVESSFCTSQKITISIGNSAKLIAEELNKKINQ